MGDFQSPFSTLMNARPLAPAPVAISVMASIWPWVAQAKPLAFSALTTPPPATVPLNTLNALPRNSSVKSANSSPNRVSGLSLPNRFKASTNGMRGNGVGMSRSSATFHTRRSRPSINV